MKEPVLVIMAAGMGSRYGGRKQTDPVDEHGSILMDFSIYDAERAGFSKVVFIIKEEDQTAFRQAIGSRIEKYIDTAYVYQKLDHLPAGYAVPAGRTKPWGTAHAVLSCMGTVEGPFAVINADDYYGPNAFRMIYGQLCGPARDGDGKYAFSMVSYRLKNTISENGSVARGECVVGADGKLVSVAERTSIRREGGQIVYTADDGSVVPLDEDTPVSMNIWGFTEDFITEAWQRFPAFLDAAAKAPLKAEYYLPSVVSRLIDEKKASVTVLDSCDKWFGMTYKEDKPGVVRAIQDMKEAGIYPDRLWT